mmetsp:Transcript_119922/g.274769  ORF Transcript_119922/g.274769 Transcript_119922/m.274769 type:complete len:460 (+) Transcript_119922:580-1959(+)
MMPQAVVHVHHRRGGREGAISSAGHLVHCRCGREGIIGDGSGIPGQPLQDHHLREHGDTRQSLRPLHQRMIHPWWGATLYRLAGLWRGGMLHSVIVFEGGLQTTGQGDGLRAIGLAVDAVPGGTLVERLLGECQRGFANQTVADIRRHTAVHWPTGTGRSAEGSVLRALLAEGGVICLVLGCGVEGMARVALVRHNNRVLDDGVQILGKVTEDLCVPVHGGSSADDSAALNSSGELASRSALPGMHLRPTGNCIKSVAFHTAVECLIHKEQLLGLFFLCCIKTVLAGGVTGGPSGGHHQHVVPAGPVLNRCRPTPHRQALLGRSEPAILLTRLLEGAGPLGSPVQREPELALEPHRVRKINVRPGVAGVRDVCGGAAVLRHAGSCSNPGTPTEHEAIPELLALNLVVVKVVPRHAIHRAIGVLCRVTPLAHGLGVGDGWGRPVALLCRQVVAIVHLVNS